MSSIKSLKKEYTRLDKSIEDTIRLGMDTVDYLKYPENPRPPADILTLRQMMDHVKVEVFEQLDIMKELERRGHKPPHPSCLSKKHFPSVMDWLEHYADNEVPMEEPEMEEGEVN